MERYKRGNVARIFPSNSILDPVSTPRNALWNRRTEVSKMETVNYIVIWRHASWENLSALILPTPFLSLSRKGDSLFRPFDLRPFFRPIVSIVRCVFELFRNGGKKETMIQWIKGEKIGKNKQRYRFLENLPCYYFWIKIEYNAEEDICSSEEKILLRIFLSPRINLFLSLSLYNTILFDIFFQKRSNYE